MEKGHKGHCGYTYMYLDPVLSGWKRVIKVTVDTPTYLDPVLSSVEQLYSTYVGEHGVCGILQHVVSDHWREVSLLQEQHE